MYDMHVQTTTANMILETLLEMSIETAKTKCYKKQSLVLSMVISNMNSCTFMYLSRGFTVQLTDMKVKHFSCLN